MGIRDRIQTAARQLLAAGTPEQPPVAPAADVVDDPNVLMGGGNRGLGDLWYSTSSLVNAVTGVGTRRDASFFNSWGVPRPLRRGELYGLGRNAISYQALSKLPHTAMREGWRVVITQEGVEDPGAVSDQIAAYEERLSLAHHMARAMTRGRQYGEAMVVLGIDDGQEMSEPVDVTAIRSIKWAAVIDVRHYQPAELYQANDSNFTKVKLFRITDINGFLEDGLRSGPDSLSFTTTSLPWETRQAGELLVHRDRVMHFPTVDYLSLLETIQDSLGAFFETMSGIRTAARESTTVVYYVSKWLRKMWSENAGLAQQHMSLVDQAKGVLNAWVADKEQEQVDIKSRSLAGVADLANVPMVWLSAALASPVTTFWGVSPGGFGKGEAERETWHEEVRAYFATAAKPELHRVSGYILAAQDGPNLPFTTQRTIELNDLSPPDEETRSKLRTDALSDLRQLVKDGVISRAEARPAVASLADDYFRPEVDLDAAEDAQLAPVGVFTGATALLQALYPPESGGIPIEAGRELMLALASTYFTPENVVKIFPEKQGPAAPGAPTPAPDGTATGAAPGDIEDDEHAAEQVSEVALAWSQNPVPPDAAEASVIAKELGIPTVRITRAHQARIIEGWNLLGGKPRYSREEVQRVILQGNGKLPAPEPEVKDVRDARTAAERGALSLCVVVRAPQRVAQWVPYKAEDLSAPHVTLLYIGDVAPARVVNVIDAVRKVLAESPLDEIAIELGEVGYFDNDKRVAHVAVLPTADLSELHFALRSAVEGLGIEVKHYPGGFKPHLTLAYLPKDAEYDGPVPPYEGWTACDLELWCDDFAIPLPIEGCTPEQVQDFATVHDRGPLTTEGWIWRTQRDKRVRKSHRKLEGKRYPPKGRDEQHGEPGEEANCRCAKELIMPPGSTKKARVAAKRAVNRALARRYKQITVAAEKRQAERAAEAGRDDDAGTDADVDATCDGFFERGSDPKVYTKPDLRNRLRSKILREGRGGSPGEWSARKAQLLALEYKRAGGGYRDGCEAYEVEDYLAAVDYVDTLDRSPQQRSLEKWTREEWMTCLPSGPSKEAAGSKRRYLPRRACEQLSKREREATNRKKAEGARNGAQFVANTEAAKEARSRATDAADEGVDAFAVFDALMDMQIDDAIDDFDEDAWLAECEDMSDEAKRKRIDEAFAKYHAAVNMGAAELERWSKTAWSKKASLSRGPIERNLRLLRKRKEDWTLADASSAMRTVNFVSRMKGAEQGKPVKIDGREGPSKRDISLLNWAFDPRK